MSGLGGRLFAMPQHPQLAEIATLPADIIWPTGYTQRYCVWLRSYCDLNWGDNQKLEKRVAALEARIPALETKEKTIMADVDKLTADFTKYQQDVTAALAALQAEIANQPPVSPAVQAKLDALDAAVNAADTGLPKTGA